MRSRSPLMAQPPSCSIKTAILPWPLLDYEFTGPDTLAEAYEKVRPPFAETGAARLPMGLNIGARSTGRNRPIPNVLPQSPVSSPMRNTGPTA